MNDDSQQKLIVRIERLEQAVFGSIGKNQQDDPGQISQRKPINFSLNERAYAEKYCKTISSAGKFTLLVAYIARGDEKSEVSYALIKDLWERMKIIIGKYNPAYSDQAKRGGWVDPAKKGFYKLNPSWLEVSK